MEEKGTFVREVMKWCQWRWKVSLSSPSKKDKSFSISTTISTRSAESTEGKE
jgi:hypothetical protein